jgi:streptogramin lyase
MPPRFAARLPAILMTLFALVPASSLAQVIDFETLPGGGSTVDQQEISTEYASLGVTFTLLSRTTGLPIGFPRIAKAGVPQTAFEGCLAADTPYPNLGLGSSFLTDGTTLGAEGDVRIEYTTPVARASGSILDIDCRTNGGPPCEQWTITAYDINDAVLQTKVLDAPQGPPNPGCLSPQAGPGDSQAFGWFIDTGTAQIKSIILSYSGAATNVGLAFDNFSVSSLPGPPDVTVLRPIDTICPGESIVLEADVSGGLPPYTFQWQQESVSPNWFDLGTSSMQEIHPSVTTRYRVIVTDALAQQTTSAPVEIVVQSGGPLCLASLLVSSNTNSRVIRYSFQSALPEVLVSTGLGGLSGPSKLVCGGDGRLYVTSQNNDRVLRYDASTGAFVDIFVTAGSGGLDIPVGLDFGPDGNLYVASNTGNSVLRYDGGSGAFIDAFVPGTSGLNGPTGIVFGPDGNLYVSSRAGDKVMRFDGTTGAPMGDFVTAGSGGLDLPRGLTFGPDGNLYVAEEVNDSVRRYDGTTGAFIDVFVASGSGGLDRANDVAFGPDGVLYVPSFNSNQVLCFDGTSGAFLRALPDGVLNGPAWVAVGCPPATTAVPTSTGAPSGLALERNVPNPFSPRTTIGFTLPAAGRTEVKIVDIAGRVVATLLDRQLSAGRHTVEWNGHASDGRVVPAGVYFLRVRSGGEVRALKMLRTR